MILDRRVVGPFVENSYLVVDDATGHSVLIDPGDEPRQIIEMVDRSGATLDAIWLTHAHIDHIGAIAGVRARWRVPVYLHSLDRPLFERAAEFARIFEVPYEPSDLPDHDLAEGDVLSVGSSTFRVLHTPGHAPGHVIFVGDHLVLGGDMLFRGSIGRTDLPYCDARAMQTSLERIATLDPDLVVHPGHGDSTSVGEELENNPYVGGIARVTPR